MLHLLIQGDIIFSCKDGLSHTMLYDDAFCRAGEIAVWHVGLTFFISGRKRVADLQHVLFLRRENRE